MRVAVLKDDKGIIRLGKHHMLVLTVLLRLVQRQIRVVDQLLGRLGLSVLPENTAQTHRDMRVGQRQELML